MLPDNLSPWERALAIAIQALVFGGGTFLVVWLWRKVQRAFQEGLHGDEEGKR